jgi:chemosensory pili system protein ChpA (sensor histidine kinase/response regulator)
MTAPFEHLLRNAIAHGLETPEARKARGKPELGEIALTVRQEGNEFVLTFADDGAGINVDRVRQKAISKGLMQATDNLTDAQIAEFIFAAGFSTADAISEVAGRGVGMDVVRAEVAGLGGRVDIDFKANRGTTFTIYLPLTLAVTQVVLVRAGGRMFAFPSVMVERVRQSREEDLLNALRAKNFISGGRDHPFYYLPHLVGDLEPVPETKRLNPIMILRSGAQRVAIFVDQLIGNQEVVVKNIGPQLARVTGIAGATVLGNGQIVLILNPVQLQTSLAQVEANMKAGGSAPVASGPTKAELEEVARAVPTVMVVDDSLTVRKITSRFLSREGYNVVTAKDGVDALEQLQTVHPDVMLVDIEMPRMDGFDLTRNVRADAALSSVPIIMISSRTADKHRSYAKEIGVNLFLGKPYQEDELLENIAEFTKHRAHAVAA